jgi:hypothetical protein
VRGRGLDAIVYECGARTHVLIPYGGGMSKPAAAIAELDVLRALIEAQLQRITEQESALSERDQRIATQQRQIKNRDRTVQHLNHEVARLKRLQFGAKTEAGSAL